MHFTNHIVDNRLPVSATLNLHELVHQSQGIVPLRRPKRRTAGGVVRSRNPHWIPAFMVLFLWLAWMVAPESVQGADPITYTFQPKNESGDTAKGWYIHLPPAFTANDVLIKDSGGKILTKVRVIDRGRKTGVTVLFETDGAGVPDKGTDEIKLTLTKPIGKTGTSGFRDKDGVKGIPVGEATFDPPWTDSKGGMGGTPPKVEKKRQEAPPEEDTEITRSGTELSHDFSDVQNPAAFEGTGIDGEDEEIRGNDYPFTTEETNDELFGDWADGDEWDVLEVDVMNSAESVGFDVEFNRQ